MCIECLLLISNRKKTSLHNSIECIIHQTTIYKEKKNRWHSYTHAQNIGLHGRQKQKKTLLLNPIIIWYNFFLQMLQTYTATSKERGYRTRKKNRQRKMTHANDSVLTEFVFARREFVRIFSLYFFVTLFFFFFILLILSSLLYQQRNCDTMYIREKKHTGSSGTVMRHRILRPSSINPDLKRARAYTQSLLKAIQVFLIFN